ncbi:MAG: PIN domain-containing protein [Turicibacter sp.]|nr:PIN domain-containing protein [Turicibacter sp.]
MKVLLDTNVILDVLLERQPHFFASSLVAKACKTACVGCLAVSQTTDIFYLLRRDGFSKAAARESIAHLDEKFELLNTEPTDLRQALTAEMTDFEDALLAFCAARHGVDFIITRNVKDFNLSPVPAITPQDFVERYVEK